MAVMKALVLIICLNLLLAGCAEQEVFTSQAQLEQRYTEQIIKAADISTDGELTVFSDNKQVCLWDNLANKKRYCLTGLEAQLIELVGISKSKRYLFTSNRVNVHLYDLAAGRLITVWNAGDNIINDIAMADNEQIAVLAFRSGQASVVSLTNNNIATFDIHRLDINSVSISSDGKQVLTGSSDKFAKLWHSHSGEIIQSFEHQTRVNHVVMSGNAKLAFTLDAIKDRNFWLLGAGKKYTELGTSIKFIEFNDATFANNNHWLLSASPKQKIQMWQVESGDLLAQWQAFKTDDRDRASVLAIEQVAPNTIATFTSDGVYQTWPVNLIL